MDGERARRSFIFLAKPIGQSITASHRCDVMGDLKRNIPLHTLDFPVKPKKLIESAFSLLCNIAVSYGSGRLMPTARI